MRIIAVNTGVKFGEWYVNNLKYIIDKYSGLSMIVLKLLEMKHIIVV